MRGVVAVEERPLGEEVVSDVVVLQGVILYTNSNNNMLYTRDATM